jgi:hypothetical protein
MSLGAHRNRLLLLLAAMLTLGALAPAGAGATQTHLVEEEFGPVHKPVFNFPSTTDKAVAVVQSSHDLLVLERAPEQGQLTRWKANGEPDNFSALGTNAIDAELGPGKKPCAEEPSSCDVSIINGFKGLRPGSLLQVAVDDSSGPTAGNIYVTEFETGSVHIFASSGAYLGRLTRCGTTKIQIPSGLAVDPSGNVYIGDFENGAVHKFVPTSGTPVNNDCAPANDIKIPHPDSIALGTGPSAGYIFVVKHSGEAPNLGGLYKVKISNGQIQYAVLDGLINDTSPNGVNESIVTITTDPGSGHLFVSQEPGRIDEYDVSGSSAATMLSTISLRAGTLAVDGLSGRIYTAQFNSGSAPVLVFGPAIVTQPAVITAAPPAVITPSRATLKGTVDPDGQELTKCAFEYGISSKPYEHTVPCSMTPAEIGTAHGPVAVEARVTGLPPNASQTLRYRLIAENANGAPVAGVDKSFSTTRLAVTGVATAVTGVAAVLNGTVNPDGSPVSACSFQYLPTADFANEVQTVSLSSATGGTFTLSLEGQETASLPFNASAAQVQAALNDLPALGGGTVSVAAPAAGGPYTVTFGAVNVPQLAADASSLSPSGATATVVTGTEGKGWADAATAPCAESAAEIGEGESPVPVHAATSALAAGTTYSFRLTATNGTDGPFVAAQSTFTTLRPVVTDPPGAISGHSGVLNGTVDSYGATVQECFFEWGATSALEQAPAPCVSPSAAEIPADSNEHAVHAGISGLSPGTEYHFRLVVKTSSGTERGNQRSFVTFGPQVVSEWAIGVTVTEGTVTAQINPRAAATTYHLEWGKDGAPYEHVTAESTSIGSDNTARTVSVPLHGLEADTAYHYRFLATSECNPLEAAEVCTFEGAEREFRTYPPRAEAEADCANAALRIGASAHLPDCRAYEMVSPVDKNGAGIAVLDGFAVAGFFSHALSRIDQARPDGNAIAYSSAQAFANPISAPWSSQYLAERGASGWSTRVVNPPLGKEEIYTQRAQEIPFRAFSEDLCSAWLLQQTNLTLTPGAPTPAPNLYRRDTCGGGGYEALTSVAPPGFTPRNGETEFLPTFIGATDDGAHSFFKANGKLTSDAAPGATNQLYESSEGGGLRLVSVLPNGEAGAVPTDASNQDYHNGPIHTIAAGGKRVFWTGAAVPNIGTIYMRANPLAPAQNSIGECMEPNRACTVRISGPGSQFHTASSDGSRVIYQTGADLFEAAIEQEGGALVSHSNQIAGGVAGVVGASSDVSKVYFTSREVLAPGGQAGQPNVYLYEAGEPAAYRYVATVHPLDSSAAGLYAIDSPTSGMRHSRVSADGSDAVFVSRAQLTGYDNTDANSGQPDIEVFLYETEAEGGAGALRCISCNPTGARPEGRDLGLASETLPHYWSAAEIPAWEYTNHAPRVLSADGSRLFFESYDGLLLSDTNGKTDIYEWQRASSQEDCDEVGAQLFVATAGGCLSLISSGESPENAELVDASADGRDVFFLTGQSLFGEDPGLIDIYDAREGGGFPLRTPAPACQGEACQATVIPPNDPTPASSSFEGTGNQHQKSAAKKKKHNKKHHGKKAGQKRKKNDHRGVNR